MNDFEVFSQHWQNAVDGLVGRMMNSEKTIFTQSNINDMWQEELLDHRFLSRLNEAGGFLKDLRERDYDAARQVEELLSDSRLDVGMAPELCAIKAIGAAAALSLSAGGTDRHAMWRLLSGAVGAVLAGTAACDVAAASKERLIKSAAAAAQRQLELFRGVLK